MSSVAGCCDVFNLFEHVHREVLLIEVFRFQICMCLREARHMMILRAKMHVGLRCIRQFGDALSLSDYTIEEQVD